jgi:hypothetical protein
MGRHMTQREVALKQRVTERPCELCGWAVACRIAAHIIDHAAGGPYEEWNLISLCPNCAEAFDHILKPRLMEALEHWQSDQDRTVADLKAAWGYSTYYYRFGRSTLDELPDTDPPIGPAAEAPESEPGATPDRGGMS